jgi:hypothetical protein
MIRNLSFFFIFIFAGVGLLSCEKEVYMNLSDSPKKVVVEGVIETGQQPYVTLTKSIGFFDKIDLSSVNYVSKAIITVEDLTSSKKITLREYNLDTTVGNAVFSFSFYAPDFNDANAMAFKGEVNHYYKLTIIAEGNIHEAITKIPTTTGLDSIWIEPVPGREDSFSSVKAFYIDPDTLGNAVRIETLTKRYIKTGDPELYFTSFNSVYDDAIINGTIVPLTIDLGFDKSKTYTQQNYQTIGYVKKGDTVTVKWSAIDKNVYTFWQTLIFSAGSVGNPFASPTKIQSNVSNALGVWAGYGANFYTVIDSL